MAKGIAVLMYHELELPGRPLCQSDPGYRRYVVPAAQFESQLRHLKSVGYLGTSIGKLPEGIETKQFALTFDDGCATDLGSAAPILKTLGFNATFYVTVGFLGKAGYMTEAQVRELGEAGFEIGCHSMTHPYLTDLDSAGLHREIVEAKDRLERIVGHAIEHYSCPGGRWNYRVVAKVKEAGYLSLATSHPRLYSSNGDAFSIGRTAILRNMSVSQLEAICEGRGLLRLALTQQMRSAAQRLVGNRLYDGLRSALLSRSE